MDTPNFEPYQRLPIAGRDRRLLWEVVTMVDPDTLRDNLERVGLESDDEDGDVQVERLRDDLARIAAYLDEDGRFQREWTEGPRAGL